MKELLPQDKVTQHIELKPDLCPCGGTTFDKADEEPLRHQVIDIRPIEPEVIEYVQSNYRCRACGELVYQSLPDEIKRRHFGPGVLVSDRWGGYNFYAGVRQICWAHLKRDFKALSQAPVLM